MPGKPRAAVGQRREILAGDDEIRLRQLANDLLADLERVAVEVSRRVLNRHPALASLDAPVTEEVT